MNSKLPMNWVQKESRTYPGKFYYANLRTRETRWSRPDPSLWEAPNRDKSNRDARQLSADSSCMDVERGAEECLEISHNSLDCVADCVECSEDALLEQVEAFSPAPNCHEGVYNPQDIRNRNNQVDETSNAIFQSTTNTQKENTELLPSPSLHPGSDSPPTSAYIETTATVMANRKSRNRRASKNNSTMSSIVSRIFGINNGGARRNPQQKRGRPQNKKYSAIQSKDINKSADKDYADINGRSQVDVESSFSDVESRVKEGSKSYLKDHVNSPLCKTTSEVESFLTPASDNKSMAYTPLRSAFSAIGASSSHKGLSFLPSNPSNDGKSVVLEKRIFDHQIIIVKTLLTFIVVENLSLVTLGLCYYFGALQAFRSEA